MKPFDLEAAKHGAEVCTRRGNSVRIITFYSKAIIDGTSQPIIVEFECDNGNVVVSSFSGNGHYLTKEKSPYDLMMRDDDYRERLEWIEYGDHIADASKMVAPTVKENLTVATPTCKDSLQVNADIIDTLKKLDSLVYDIQYQAGNIVVDAINVSEKLKYILKKMQDNGEQE